MNYTSERKTVRILLTDDESLAVYDTILNSSGITILREKDIEEKETLFNDEGKAAGTISRPYLIVTYLEKMI